MKRAATLVLATLLAPALVLAGEAPSAGPGEPVDQVYFDATISKAGRPVTQPHALVRAGSTAQFSLGPKSATGPRLGLRYIVPAAGAENPAITVAGLLDGREVVSAPLDITSNPSAGITLDGGGYTWRVHALRLTPEALQRRQAPRR
ncbi:MAG TPA: hypothetical protein VGG33_27815 [Polyangia bacterium]